MMRSFYILVITQFLSGIADSALLIAAIARLVELHSPHWMTPLLKVGFNASYVLLAVVAGTLADAVPKGRLMLGMNFLKAIGCLSMIFSLHPLLCYAVVGFGAASYSPAKTGLITELVPARQLVVANGWLEGSTVVSIILGTVLGGLLIQPQTLHTMLGTDLIPPSLNIDTPAEAAILVITAVYALSMLVNFKIRGCGNRARGGYGRPGLALSNFWHSCRLLWRDEHARISLAATSLFWAAGATLQFLFLNWAQQMLGLPLGKAALIQGAFAMGTAVGAFAAARRIPLERAFRVLPLGIGCGVLIMLLPLITTVWGAYFLLILVGLVAGFFIVPLNAVLQQRGLALANAGQSIAIQNFSENISVLAMLAAYATLLKLAVPVNLACVALGAFVVAMMLLILNFETRTRIRTVLYPTQQSMREKAKIGNR